MVNVYCVDGQCWCDDPLCNKGNHFFCLKSPNQKERNKRVWASYIKMKLPGHLFEQFQRISWIVLDWIPPTHPPSLTWRTFAEVAKPSCPAPVADTTKMGVLMVFAKKSLRSLFPDSPVSKNGANDVKCTVRMLGQCAHYHGKQMKFLVIDYLTHQSESDWKTYMSLNFLGTYVFQ